MTQVAQLAVSAAVVLCIASTVFGVAMARLMWAEDLQHATRIDEIRSQTEQHLMNQIKSLESHIRILEGKK
jgi:hypothetical protein